MQAETTKPTNFNAIAISQRLTEQYQLAFLGGLPLQKQIRELADRGMPIVAAMPESDTAKLYRDIARKISAQIALLPIDYGTKIPQVVTAK